MNIIEKTSGPCIVLAGAGTGKTYTIVEKIKYLIKNKIYEPEKIVCITFSNEAANNLTIRIKSSLEGKNLPIIRTFHAFASDLLRNEGKNMEINEDFNILTPDEAKVLMHRAMRIFTILCHKYVSTISTVKDLGISLNNLKEYLEKRKKLGNLEELEKEYENLQFSFQTIHLSKDKSAKKEITNKILALKNLIDITKFCTAWETYEKIKKKQNYLDYSDLNLNALEILKKFPEIALKYDYVIVDEFQDTNKIQIDFLKYLSPNKNIMVVGDVNQSIYRFRGAYKDNINLFKSYFDVKKEDIFALKESFRSPNKILRNAHKIILNNYENKEECFYVENKRKIEGDNIEIYELENPKEEARKIVEIIKKELENGKNLEDICIIFRTHQQGAVIKRALEQEKISFSAVSKSSLLKNPAIKTIIDYLTILDSLNRNSQGGEQAWWDLIYQTGFTDEDLIMIGKFIKEKSSNLSQEIYASLDSLPLSVSGRIYSRSLKEKIKKMLESKDKKITELLLEIYNISGIMSSGILERNKEIMLNLDKFLETAENHQKVYSPDLMSFVNYLNILSELGIEIESATLENKGVRLMTLHATKGLEYKVIIITNMAQKRFPMERIKSNSLIPNEILPEFNHLNNVLSEERENIIEEHERHHQLLEERRLCYVAFTRTKEKLYITYAKEYGGKRYTPSIFLEEIEFKKNPDIKVTFDNLQISKPLEEKEASLKLASLINSSNPEELIAKAIQGDEKILRIPQKHKVFSPSALLTFEDCQKKYEYKYIYNMPERKIVSWEAVKIGSFLHTLFEEGVKSEFKKLKQYLDKAYEMHLSEDWNSVDLDSVEHMIKVFFERNKDKYDKNSMTEQELTATLGKFNFLGFADRIDFREEGIEIIDYKTGKNPIAPKHRNWQLGFYALAAKKLGKVKTITLDMLQQEKPLEFHLDESGNASGAFSSVEFNIYDIEKELIDTAEKITNAYESGFTACPPEKNCEFCNEYVYGY